MSRPKFTVSHRAQTVFRPLLSRITAEQEAIARAALDAARKDREMDETAQLDQFVERAAAKMRDRLDHGARKFGALSWRDESYTDDQNHARLLRAVEHLWAALANGTGADECEKRAADVANQAFMYADPDRMRSDDQS